MLLVLVAFSLRVWRFCSADWVSFSLAVFAFMWMILSQEDGQSAAFCVDREVSEGDFEIVF